MHFLLRLMKSNGHIEAEFRSVGAAAAALVRHGPIVDRCLFTVVIVAGTVSVDLVEPVDH
jgi:hypothetical protein